VAYSEVQNRQGNLQSMNLNLYDVDWDFIPQYGMKLVAGRAFSRDFPSDTTQAFIVNQTAVKDLGYTSAEAAIGRQFNQWGRKGKIIGVVKDFHFQSLQSEVKALNLRLNKYNMNVFTLKIKGGDIPNTI